MKKTNLFRNLLVGMTCASALATVNAATQPKFTIIPTTPTTIDIPSNATAMVSYTVTNMTKITRTLVMKTIDGITQDTTGTGACANPFTLAPQQSCTLNLSLNGNTLPRLVKSGPVICKTQDASNNAPDPFLCSQPTLADSLNVQVMRQAFTITPDNLSLLAGSGVSKSFKVTSNLLVRNALNVAADLTGTALEGNVIQDATDCRSLAPGASCHITFTPENQAVGIVTFPVRGTNTTAVGASIEVTKPNTATISLDPEFVELQVGGSPQTITVTNESPVFEGLNAVNITATLSESLSGTGGPSVTASAGCASLAPGASTCIFTFTPGTAPTDEDPTISGTVAIKGTNTTQQNANVAVAAVGAAELAFASGSATTLALQLNGNAGQMTVQNKSITSPAQGVKADFTDTGIVLSSVTYQVGSKFNNTACPDIPANGGTCVITFNPGSTPVAQTTPFPIGGSNAVAITGNLSIGSFAYIMSAFNGKVIRCPITSTGQLGSDLLPCVDSGFNTNQMGTPSFIAVNSQKTRLFMTSGSNNNLISCLINKNASISSSPCDETGAFTASLSNPIGISALPSTTYPSTAFVANRGNDTVSSCVINANGVISSCQNSGATLTTDPYGLTVNPAGTKVYFSNPSDHNVIVCSVSPGAPATLTGCLNTNAISTGVPTGIAFNSAGTILYIADQGNNNIRICTVINSNGTVDSSSCTNIGSESSFSGPTGIVLNTLGANSAAPNSLGNVYVTNQYTNPTTGNDNASTVKSYPITDSSTGAFSVSGVDSTQTFSSIGHSLPTGIALLQH